jgi:hypothetical protein
MDQDEATAEEYYREFIERARVTGEVWGLLSDGGWAYCESGEFEDTDVVLFWSDRAAAEKLAEAEWSDHRAVSISLDDFIDRWLCGMDEDGALVGPNWDADLNGFEVDPREIADRLTEDDEED